MTIPSMAIYATNAKRATDKIFIEAAHAVADQVTPEQLKLGMVFPLQRAEAIPHGPVKHPTKRE